MEFTGAILYQPQAPSSAAIGAFSNVTKHKPASCQAKISSSSGESFNIRTTYPCWKTLETKDNTIHAVQHSSFSHSNISCLPELSFSRLQPSEDKLCTEQKHSFGRFVARCAVLDEEYWAASWLRAESHWESLSYMRHVDMYKRKYAEREFYALKHRRSSRDGNSVKCFCIVAVKKEEKHHRRTVLNSVVGTLDLSIRQFLQGEAIPGNPTKTSAVLMSHEACNSHRYAYVANVCVSKYARREGIATNMLHFATNIASGSGMRQLFMHANIDNEAAQDLYRKVGFRIVEDALPSKNRQILLSLEL